jgi:hypothetical protein
MRKRRFPKLTKDPRLNSIHYEKNSSHWFQQFGGGLRFRSGHDGIPCHKSTTIAKTSRSTQRDEDGRR